MLLKRDTPSKTFTRRLLRASQYNYNTIFCYVNLFKKFQNTPQTFRPRRGSLNTIGEKVTLKLPGSNRTNFQFKQGFSNFPDQTGRVFQIFKTLKIFQIK
jgi:hypothetical protein